VRNEELHNLYTSPNTIRDIKLKKMRLIGHVARIEEMRNAYKILVEELEDVGVYGMIILNWI
jgi:hypothetical protein